MQGLLASSRQGTQWDCQIRSSWAHRVRPELGFGGRSQSACFVHLARRASGSVSAGALQPPTLLSHRLYSSVTDLHWTDLRLVHLNPRSVRRHTVPTTGHETGLSSKTAFASRPQLPGHLCVCQGHLRVKGSATSGFARRATRASGAGTHWLPADALQWRVRERGRVVNQVAVADHETTDIAIGLLSRREQRTVCEDMRRETSPSAL